MLAGLGRLQLVFLVSLRRDFPGLLRTTPLSARSHSERRNEEYIFQTSPRFSRIAVGLALASLVVAFAANSNAAFIYFQF